MSAIVKPATSASRWQHHENPKWHSSDGFVISVSVDHRNPLTVFKALRRIVVEVLVTVFVISEMRRPAMRVADSGRESVADPPPGGTLALTRTGDDGRGGRRSFAVMSAATRRFGGGRTARWAS
ncbi:hypothetical protein [Amycolatopsis decaplanina]|uniref:hypothetical protein n=1 Tax=Amycolatopsis decaplanina TaxID=208441 RepID=UPI0012697531|nr:hypothetical protein [Amycolatopsis decaplanina]